MELKNNISSLEKALNNSAGSKLERVLNLIPEFISEWWDGFNPLRWRRGRKETLPYVFGVFSSCCAGLALFAAAGSATIGTVPRFQKLQNKVIKEEAQQFDMSKLAKYETLCKTVAKEEDVPLYIVQGILLEGLGKYGQARRETGDYFGICALKPTEAGYLPKLLKDNKRCLEIAVRNFNEIGADNEQYALAVYFAGERVADEALTEDFGLAERIRLRKESRNNLIRKYLTAEINYKSYEESTPELAEKYRAWMNDLKQDIEQTEQEIEEWTNQQLFAYRLPEPAREAVLQTLCLKEYGIRKAN